MTVAKTSVGSRQELVDRAQEDIDVSVELHRPYVDDIHLTCSCGSTMNRVPDVIDCWFDSGAMPFAQHHYPFENKEEFDGLFPADFICEGIDQTRGWFYSLLAISTFVMGKAPYKNVLVNDLILDKEGKKMSKSKGNVLDSFKLFDQYGADAVRWYMYYVSPAWTPTKFDEDGLKEVKSKFFGTLENVYNFLTLYANTDGIDFSSFKVDPAERPELDRWVLSKLNSLIKNVTEDLEVFDTTKAVRKIQEFVNEDLSNWYIRRSRRRFWATELTDDKKAVYNTTAEVLVAVAQLSAPFAPYITEMIYQNLTGEKSVHLSMYPEVREDLIDLKVEEKMDLVRDLVGLGRSARESVKIKVRQPISKVLIDGKHQAIIDNLVPLIQEELNVKEVMFETDLNQYMNFSLKPNFRVVGPMLGKQIGQFGKVLSSLDASIVAPQLESGEEISVDLGGQDFTVNKERVMVNIDAKEGFTVKMENNRFVILDTTLNEDLVNEGYAREFISRIQQIRKNNGYEMMDNIHIYYNSTDDFAKAVEMHKEYIMKETLALSLTDSADKEFEAFKLNDHLTNIKLEKA